MSLDLMLPDHPAFYGILHGSVPPGAISQYYCVSHDTGLLYPADEQQALDYILSGEYEAVMAQQADEEEN